MNEPSLTHPHILYAEDNADDVELMRTALERSSLKLTMHHVENGAVCMQFLRRRAGYENAPRPDLLLLDINMPLMDGFQVMEEIGRDEELRSLPVVVLTTSSAHDAVARMYQLRCSSYIRKPLGMQELLRVVQTMFEYWLTVVTLPTR